MLTHGGSGGEWTVLPEMLTVRITKRADGGGVLRCVRADGSVTWQKQSTRHAAHFALHDLTHFAVETTLRSSQGFYGLIAAGWDVEDTTGKGTRGALPPEALEVERIVGLFDTERAGGSIWTAEDFNNFSPRPMTLEQIQAIRARRSELFQRWFAIEPGAALELQYPS